MYKCSMTTLQHVYMTAHGAWTTGAWVGESAQFGIRIPFATTLNPPSQGEIFTPLTNQNVVMDQGTLAGVHGSLTRTWTAGIGTVLPGELMNAAGQVDLAEGLWAFLDTIKALNSNSYRWTHIRMAPIDAQGKQTQPSSLFTFTAPMAGLQASVLPPQLAFAVSMRANIIGRRGRGRIYLPALGAGTVAADGTITVANATTARNAMKTLVDETQNVAGWNLYRPIVAIMSPGSATAVRPSEVRTGNRMDTIQSRRRQVTEVYTALPL